MLILTINERNNNKRLHVFIFKLVKKKNLINNFTEKFYLRIIRKK